MTTWVAWPGQTGLEPVRGIVAARLGRRYTGVELRAQHVAANREQAARICPPTNRPRWLQGDARDVRALTAGGRVDLVSSCPPYADLEVSRGPASDRRAC